MPVIVAWLMGLVFCAFYAYAVFMIPRPGEAMKLMVIRTVPILIVGFVLIYIFRNKKINPKH
jgi:branched-subunit amino acid transport protein AzlD